MEEAVLRGAGTLIATVKHRILSVGLWVTKDDKRFKMCELIEVLFETAPANGTMC